MANRKPKVETDEFASFAWRIVRAYGRRIADGDISNLHRLADLRDSIDDELTRAVHDLRRDYGYSWADIGRELGVTRASAQQRFANQPG